MKRTVNTETSHINMNIGIVKVLNWCDLLGAGVEFKLADRMKERGLTVRRLSELSGLRTGTISALMTGKKNTLNISHIFILMLVLRITDINDIVTIKFAEYEEQTMNKEAYNWITTGEVPELTKVYGEVIQGRLNIE